MTQTKLKRRELLTLAQTADVSKSKIGGWLVSEKLDGTRCFWDGGITRGVPTVDVPWAGILNPKKPTERKDKIKPISTGLWSRYGNPIIAPDWFIDELPPLMMDGELFAGRGNFQLCRSIVAGDSADSRWDQIKYMVYGAPSIEVITEPGLIKSPQQYCEIAEDALQDTLTNFVLTQTGSFGWAMFDSTFQDVLTDLSSLLETNRVAEVHLQKYLPASEKEAWSMVEKLCKEVVSKGGEGVIIRNPMAMYETKRTKSLLKFKPSSDDEGTLVGFTAGKGKYEGMIGNLILNYQGKRLELSGMTDDERQVIAKAPLVPGKEIPADVEALHFTIGQKIEFTFRELSDAGIPKEARFKRAEGGTNAL